MAAQENRWPSDGRAEDGPMQPQPTVPGTATLGLNRDEEIARKNRYSDRIEMIPSVDSDPRFQDEASRFVHVRHLQQEFQRYERSAPTSCRQ